jgi:hypothetical protein
MKTVVPMSTEAVSAAYADDLQTAIVAMAALIGILLLTFLVIRATFKIARIFFIRQVVADTLAAAVLASVILIGLLNR